MTPTGTTWWFLVLVLKKMVWSLCTLFSLFWGKHCPAPLSHHFSKLDSPSLFIKHPIKHFLCFSLVLLLFSKTFPVIVPSFETRAWALHTTWRVQANLQWLKYRIFFLYFLILFNIVIIFSLTAVRYQVDFFVELSVAAMRFLLNSKLSTWNEDCSPFVDWVT